MPGAATALHNTAVSAVAIVAGRKVSSTPARLWQLLSQLLVAVLLVYPVAAAVMWQGHRTVGSVRGDAAPALLDALVLRAALSDADRAAWASFGAGEAALVGPGQEYLNDITTASQRLQHLAELTTVDGGSLQVIGGQLVNYQALVEQADASYRAGPASHELGLAYLTYASNSLHAKGSGLLPGIDELIESSQRQLDGQRTSLWVSLPASLAPAAVGLLVLVLLLRVQIFFRRSFHRATSLPLLAATALAVGFTVWVGVVSVHTGRSFDAAQHAMPTLTGAWHHQTTTADERSARLRAFIDSKEKTAAALDPTATGPLQRTFDARLASASRTYGLDVGLPAFPVGMMGLAFLAFRPRMKEYEGWRR